MSGANDPDRLNSSYPSDKGRSFTQKLIYPPFLYGEQEQSRILWLLQPVTAIESSSIEWRGRPEGSRNATFTTQRFAVPESCTRRTSKAFCTAHTVLWVVCTTVQYDSYCVDKSNMTLIFIVSLDNSSGSS